MDPGEFSPVWGVRVFKYCQVLRSLRIFEGLHFWFVCVFHVFVPQKDSVTSSFGGVKICRFSLNGLHALFIYLLRNGSYMLHVAGAGQIHPEVEYVPAILC